MSDENLPIGKAAQRSGAKVPTIRYCEQIGLPFDRFRAR
jgi:DNA-binding transcriptional MerR regulator